MKAETRKNLPDNETILEQLRWRYAVKGFDKNKKVSEEDWEVLENSLILAPSSYGLQPYKFIVVTDDELREKLRPACYGQSQITDSSHLVILAAKKDLTEQDIEEYVELIQETRGTPREMLEDYIGMMKGTQQSLTENGQATAWSQRQVYIALGFLLETAAILGIDACPMEGFEPAKVDEILDLDGYTATVLCTVGYRAEDDWLAELDKVRFPKEKLIERI
jgi:nitroreductase